MQSSTRSPTADRAEARGAAGASSLARIAFGLYVLLIAYASLYPLEGWRDHGLSAFAYLTSPWPRYATAFDLATRYQHPVMLLLDTVIAHSTETIELPEPLDLAVLPEPAWATNGAEGKSPYPP